MATREHKIWDQIESHRLRAEVAEAVAGELLGNRNSGLTLNPVGSDGQYVVVYDGVDAWCCEDDDYVDAVADVIGEVLSGKIDDDDMDVIHSEAYDHLSTILQHDLICTREGGIDNIDEMVDGEETRQEIRELCGMEATA